LCGDNFQVGVAKAVSRTHEGVVVDDVEILRFAVGTNDVGEFDFDVAEFALVDNR
jgi:hypothetical protein